MNAQVLDDHQKMTLDVKMLEILNIRVFGDFLMKIIEISLENTQQQSNLLSLFFLEREQHIY